MRYKVYISELSCLDYPLDVLISWICIWACTTGFAHIFFTCLPHYMLVCSCTHDTVSIYAFLIRIYWYTWVCLCTSLFTYFTYSLGCFLTTTGPACPDLGSCSVIMVYLYYFIRIYINTVLSYSDSYLYRYLATYVSVFPPCMYVAVAFPYPQHRGVTRLYQILGSHISSPTNQQINVILICNWSVWVMAIHSNYKYIVIFSFLIILLFNPKALPSLHFRFPRMSNLFLSPLLFHAIHIFFRGCLPLYRNFEDEIFVR